MQHNINNYYYIKSIEGESGVKTYNLEYPIKVDDKYLVSLNDDFKYVKVSEYVSLGITFNDYSTYNSINRCYCYIIKT